MPFTPINTEEEFESAIKDRIAQAKRQFDGYLSPEALTQHDAEKDKQITDLTNSLNATKSKIKEYETTIAERDKTIKGYESDSVKTRIALESGLPYEMAARLTGDDEAAIRKDAEAMAKLFKDQGNGAPPLRNQEQGGGAQSARDKFAEWFDDYQK